MLVGAVTVLCLSITLPHLASSDFTGRYLARQADQEQIETQHWDAMDVIRVIIFILKDSQGTKRHPITNLKLKLGIFHH